MRIEEGIELARYTTLGTGGAARAFARPESEREVGELLRWARERSLGVAVVGLGSNLLAADGGVEALVLKLGGELAAVEADGDVLWVGAGTANAVALHRARAAGLGGFEFACAIPGTIGGAQISPKHANFIENADAAATTDALSLMAEARRRALDRFGVRLEHEVEFLGALELPAL